MSELSPPDTLDGYCLAEEVIHALACGGLEEKERSKALAHLDECELCQALLADEVRDLPPSASADDPGLPTLIQLGSLVAGRYRIQHFVARGGMGEVYEAWDELLAERVALKTINPLVASADQARASARFRQEVQLSRRVADAHVCRIYEFGQHLVRGFGAISYLTMEFIEGQTLGARLRQGPRLPMNEVVELSRQMLRGLGAAHAVGVLHRDFKSDNVLLRDRSAGAGGLHAVIMDFGLARVLGDHAHRFTERHELVGSAAYMAPEQLEEGAELSEATDIYAFGVVLFEMLTGRLPFEGSAPVAVALRRLSHPAPPPSTHVPELKGAWDELVLRCLERNASHRFSSTDDVTEALEGVVNESPRRTRRHRQRWRNVAVAVAAGVLLVGAVSLSAREHPGTPQAADATPSVTLALEPQSNTPPSTAAAALEPAPVVAAPAVLPAPSEVPSTPAASGEIAAGSLANGPSPVIPAPVVEAPAPGGVEPAAASPATAAVTPLPRATPKAAPAVPRARATSTPSAPPSPPIVEAPHPVAARAPGDVRDIFFLEAPATPKAQNSER